ncbi:hypothetical protein K1T71_006848 [Dendrolimus kikuchii]|uniref:Uncharacterized protein n=1 Tax=Dendrolimus kikuchii TaxID=765133 RepID=A0ACC1D264_9NEOP|nr:hypothetical protein K1T71_006848 [Dendrolimus kikuchii]
MVVWEDRLRHPSAGLATIDAVIPVLQLWVRRKHGTLTFRLTQVLSGHGCFGKYLCRIGREATSECHHCDTGDEDTALHTLQECLAWAEQRRDLVAVTGLDLSLPAAERERERTSRLRSRQRRTRRRRRSSTDLRHSTAGDSICSRSHSVTSFADMTVLQKEFLLDFFL